MDNEQATHPLEGLRLSNRNELYRFIIQREEAFVAAGLADHHFEKEFSESSPEKFHQRLWEVNLAHFLWDQGFKLQSSARGPDFFASRNSQTVWIEAVSPLPQNIPEDYKEGRSANGGTFASVYPEQEVLLRVTSAINNKFKQYKQYIDTGIVRNDACCVIAVDCGQLGILGDQGIGDYPSTVAAVYPIGPIKMRFWKNTGETDAYQSLRWDVPKPNGGEPVSVSPFLDGSYPCICAILGAHSYVDGVKRTNLVHNFTANTRLPLRAITVDKEFVPVDEGETIRLDILKP